MELERVKEPQPPTTSVYPKYPNWPTSIPGPRVSEPPPGQKRVPVRTDQVAEVSYDQATGEPGPQSSERTEPASSMQGRVSMDQEQGLRRTKKVRKDL